MRKKTVQSLTLSSTEVKELGRTLIGDSLGFQDCLAATLDSLVDQGSMRILKKGQALISQGDLTHALYFLVQGNLEISVSRRDGRRHMVGYVGIGNCVGLVGLIDGKKELNDVYARIESSVFVIPADAVRILLKTDPNLGLALAAQLATRNRFLSERLAADASQSIATRLASLLLSLHTAFGPIKVSQSELADWLGCSRQRVNYALQALQKSNLIHTDYFGVEIIDADAFESFLTRS